ncbi:hypothetical protein AGR56_15640 [Clostridium sp. DMHC 10]|nr:hypothetical protein AGR56_15640 [Clostridium sp. DMHC 10]
MPKPLIGFFAAAMFGSVLSVFNGVLNSASTLFALNVYSPVLGKGKSDKEIISKGKLFGLVLAIISMTIAPFIMYAPQGLFQYLQTVNGFFVVDIKPWKYSYEASGVVLFLMVSMYVVCSKLGFASKNGIGIRTLIPIVLIAAVMYGLVKLMKARSLEGKKNPDVKLDNKNANDAQY